MNKQDLNQRFLYPNGTLKNKLGIRNDEKLQVVEYRMVAQNTLWLLHHGYHVRNISDLSKIHQFLFDDLYQWAGQFRNYYLSKGNTDFLPPESFRQAIDNINEQIDKMSVETKPSKKQYAMLLDSLNYFHPFREGNGRSIRLMLQLIAAEHYQFIDFQRQNQSVVDALHSSDIDKLQDYIILKDVKTEQAARKQAAFLQFKLLHQKHKPK